MTEKKHKLVDCDTCEGTGHGPCATCGDIWGLECSCPDPQETECDVCDGAGVLEEEVSS